MAASPKFKVYSATGEYIASTKYLVDAAVLVGAHGVKGFTIRDGHTKVLWTEGVDGAARESWDVAADIAAKRLNA